MTQEKQNGDYTTTLTVNKTPEVVYRAIINVSGWWIGDVAGKADTVGAEFTYSYKEFHDTTQKVIELVPSKKIVWLVTKSKINFVKNKNEWKDTRIEFELIPEGIGTRIKFTHSGLTPAIECFDGCSSGWDFYIKESPQSFINTGKGIDPKF